MKRASTLHAQVAVRAAVRPQPPRRAILLAATALLALSLLSAAALAQRAAASGPQPTIVLVHGAWADATGFDAEIRALPKHLLDHLDVRARLHGQTGRCALLLDAARRSCIAALISRRSGSNAAAPELSGRITGVG